MPCTSVEGSPKSQEEGDYWQFQKTNRYQLPRGRADKVAIKLLRSLCSFHVLSSSLRAVTVERSSDALTPCYC